LVMDIGQIRNVAVIGAGLMGHGLAQIFAGRGYEVSLMDVQEDFLAKARAGIRSNLTLMAQHGIGRVEDIDTVLSRVKTTTDLIESRIWIRCAPVRPFLPPIPR
jgi:3-hydroxyacyl-CoA dehydrogenase